MDEMFGEHPWSVFVAVFGIPLVAFVAELVILAVVA
jgi:hypothetical protein